MSDLIACVEEVQLGGERPVHLLGAGLCFKGMPDPRLNVKPGNDPGMGEGRRNKEAFPASKNYDLNQRLGWVGLEQAAGGEPAQPPPPRL